VFPPRFRSLFSTLSLIHRLFFSVLNRVSTCHPPERTRKGYSNAFSITFFPPRHCAHCQERCVLCQHSVDCDDESEFSFGFTPFSANIFPGLASNRVNLPAIFYCRVTNTWQKEEIQYVTNINTRTAINLEGIRSRTAGGNAKR
jgi:hypothetical protein